MPINIEGEDKSLPRQDDLVMYKTPANWIHFGRVTATRGNSASSKMDVEVSTHGLASFKATIRRNEAAVIFSPKK